MSLRMYDFKCSNGHFFEKLVNEDERTVNCTGCGAHADRLISAVRCKLEPFSGDFVTAADKWERTRDSRIKQEQKAVERHGTYWDLYKK